MKNYEISFENCTVTLSANFLRKASTLQVYEETWKWLAERNCAQLIPAQILEQYAKNLEQL